jgi:transposase InsO family protein
VHYSAPYNPQQNGVIERCNKTVVEVARALLKQRGMPTVFWGEVVVTAVYILYRSPIKALNGRTPYEASAASRSPMSLATSVSSTTEALWGCSSATRRA